MDGKNSLGGLHLQDDGVIDQEIQPEWLFEQNALVEDWHLNLMLDGKPPRAELMHQV